MNGTARDRPRVATAGLMLACAMAVACRAPAPDAHPAASTPATGAEQGAPAGPLQDQATSGGTTSAGAEGARADGVALLRAGRWDEAAAIAAHDDSPLGTALWHYVRGAAAAAQPQMAVAADELAAFEAVRRTVPADARISPSNTAAAVLDVAGVDLSARVAWAKGDFPTALLAWGRAALSEDRIAVADPPDWRLPVRERLGAALLMMKNGRQAEGVFRAELERRPANARALYGLAESLALQERTGEAAKARAAFEAAWTGTGDPLPLGASARMP